MLGRGNVAISIQPYLSGETQLTTTTSYDAYNRVSAVNVTGMGTTSVGYSCAGGNLTTTTTNPAGQASSKVTDASGQTISATDNGGTLTYSYTSQGNLLSVTQGSATPAVHEYDAYSRQTKLIDQNAGTTTYEYNAAGELTKQTNANGHVHNMVYDLMGRVTSRTGPEGTTITLYNSSGAAINQIQQISGFAGNVSNYTYDGYGRLSSSTETIDGTPYTTAYAYNTYGDVTQKTYPSGFYTNHAYDGNGYSTAITNSSNFALFTAVTQNGLGQPLLYNLGNGKTSTNTYEYGMPTRYNTPGVQDLNLTWSYASGNLQKRQDAIKNKEESFTYDNLNRLTSSTVTGLAGQFINYGPSGNITSKTDAGTYSYLASKPNAVSAVTNPTNVIPALQQLVSYTAFMQPSVLTENNYELTYTYGADYDRIKGILKQNNALQRTRYYVGAGYEKDINAVSGVSRELHYIDSPAGLIAIVVREGGVDTYHYVYADHLGSILTVTDASGTVEFEQNFDAWGRRRNTTTWAYTGVTSPPDWLYRGYTGHEHLTEFNLINMNGRLYDPVVGRVLSPDNFVQDPFSTQGFNRYSYGYNNPTKYNDPSGQFIPLIFLAAAVIGGGLNVAAHWGKIHSFQDGLVAFGIGAGAGLLTAATGGAAAAAAGLSAASIAGGAVAGAVGAAYGGALQGIGNALYFGDAFGAKEWVGGIVLGAGFGAVAGGIAALLRESPVNFWTGAPQSQGAPGAFALGNTRSLLDEGWQRVGGRWWNPLGGGSGGNVTFTSAELGDGKVVNQFGGLSSGDVRYSGAGANGPQGGSYIVENIAGYYVRGNSSIMNGTYSRTIQAIANLGEGTSMPQLLRVFENEARIGGANRIVINGLNIVEPKLINPQAIQRLGYIFQQTSKNSFQITRTIKR